MGDVDVIGKRYGNYVVESVLGAGGMGTVFAAVHPTLGKRVAIKVLRPELASDAKALGRLIDEARAATAIGHENIVQIFDFSAEAGSAYVVMEHLVGETLQDRLEREGRLEPERAVAIASQVCAALGAAHRRGIVHRDVKPQNIFLARTASGGERVKLLDFGVAKLVDAMQKAGPATATGTVVGTPYFMSPEQARGEPVDGRADIWAVGVVLYRALTGALPFEGRAFGEVIAAVLNEPAAAFASRADPASPPVPAALEHAVLHALAKDPAERPAEMAALARELSLALAAPELGESAPEPAAAAPTAAVADRPATPSESAATAIASADDRLRRRVLLVRLLALYPGLIGIAVVGFLLLMRSAVVDRAVALEALLVIFALAPVGYLTELGLHLLARRRRSARPLHLLMVTLFALGTTYAVHLNGSVTSYMVMFHAITIVFVRLRLGRGLAIYALVLALVSYASVVALEQAGLVPYGRLLPALHAAVVANEPGFAIAVVTGVASFLVLACVGADFLVRGLEQREEALAELTRGLEGKVAEQIDALRRRERLRYFLASPVVEAVARGENPARPGYERRRVALLACTLGDLYRDAAGLEPEDQVRVLNGFYGAVARAAARAGATVDAFADASALIFVGAPRSRGERDDALRALQAARELQRAIDELRPGWRSVGAERVSLRSAIHSGYVAVGNLGSELKLQYTVAGPARALCEAAARAAPAGGVVLTASARTLCGEAASSAPCGEVSTPGSGEPVALFRVEPAD
jgi:class 3 adenylate cyclase